MALTTEERKKSSDRLTELASLYNKYYWANQAQEDAARAGKGKSGFPPELSNEIGMLNNMILFGTPYNALIAQAGADRQQSDAVTASQNNLGGGVIGNLLSGNVGGAFAALDPTQGDVSRLVADPVSTVSKALSTDDAKKAMAVAAAFYLPGVGAQLGQTLVTQGLITGAAIPYAAAIGTALASTGASVAQGVPFDTALTNATVNAVTSTGSQSVAGYISKLGASPDVANAITSVGASGLATAAKGGSAADIENNMKGALAGSTVTGLTGDKLSGAVVGGGITGGTIGALTGAAGVLGADSAKTGTTKNAPPAGTVAVQDASGNTLYTDGQKYYNADGSINTAATQSAGVVSGVGTDVAGTATGMADKSAPGVSVGGSNLSLGADSYGYRIPAGTKYENGLTYEGDGQWVLPNGRRMVVGSNSWDDASLKTFDPNKSYVTSFGTFGTSETGATGTGAAGAGAGGGGGSGAGGGAGGGGNVGGGVGGGVAGVGVGGAGAAGSGGATSAPLSPEVQDKIIELGEILGLGIPSTNPDGYTTLKDDAAGVGQSRMGTLTIDKEQQQRAIIFLENLPTTTPEDKKAIQNLKTAVAQTTTVTKPIETTATTTTPKVAPKAVATGESPERPPPPILGPVIDNFPGPTTKTTDQAVIDLTGLGGGNVGGNVVVGPGTGLGAGNATGNVVIADAGAGTGTGNAAGNVVISNGGLGGGGGNATSNVVVGPGTGTGGPGGNVTIDAGGGDDGNAAANVSGNVVVDEPVDDNKKVVDDTKDDTKDDIVDETYTPDVFIYGGVSPKTKTRTTTNLGTTLQAPFYPTSTLGQALTGYRGAGEIEGKKTGKPRKNVWNEESLRLKDALGL